MYAGGRDARVSAVASIVGWGDGERHLRALRRQHEWLAFRDRVAAARTRRVVEGVDERVDPDEILLRDPEAARWRHEMVERFPEMRFDTTLESAERIMEFQPERLLPYPPGRALLVVHAEDDRLIPVEEAHALYARAAEPKRLVVLPGIQHHGIHEGDPFEECIRLTTDWFRTHVDHGARP